MWSDVLLVAVPAVVQPSKGWRAIVFTFRFISGCRKRYP
jgi:hypothetical protein